MGSDPRNLADWAQSFTKRLPTTRQLDLTIQDCRIRVTTNAVELERALSDYYRYFVGAPDASPHVQLALLECPVQNVPLSFIPYPPQPGKTRVKDEFVDFEDGRLLRKRLTQMLFLVGPSHNLAVGPCRQNLNQIVNFINNRFIDCQLDQGYLLCHAAAIARHGRGIALAGAAGRGKSTLALHLVGRGLDFVTNDRLLIRRRNGRCEMTGVPKHPRVNPGTILHNPALEPLIPTDRRESLRRLPADDLWHLEEKYDADVGRLFGADRLRLSATLVGVFLLTWHRAAGPVRIRRVRLEDRPDLLAALIKPPGVQYHAIQGAPARLPLDEAYLECLSGCPVFEVRGNLDFDVAADSCMELLEPLESP